MQYTFYLDKITALLNLELFFNTMTQINYYIDCSLVTFKICYIAIHDAIGLTAICIKTIYINLSIAYAFFCISMVFGEDFILSYPIMPDFLLGVFSVLYDATLNTNIAVAVYQSTQENPSVSVDLRGNISG